MSLPEKTAVLKNFILLKPITAGWVCAMRSGCTAACRRPHLPDSVPSHVRSPGLPAGLHVSARLGTLAVLPGAPFDFA